MAISYNYDEAAAVIGIAPTKIRALVRDNKIVARYLGKDVLIEHTELVRFVESLPSERDS